MAAWAEAEIKLPSGPQEGRKYKIDRLPYARLLFSQLGKWRRHVITGPTQSGKTLHAYVIPMLYYLFEMKEDVICGIPDLNMAGIKWQEDIKPAIEASSYADQIPQTGAGSRGGNFTRIQFCNGRSLLFMAGGGNDKQRAGATSRVLMITETDGMDEVSATSKEGQDKISQLEGRVRAFGLDSLTFMECTVTTEDGRTWREYEGGTASKIVCPCVHCMAWVTPDREHFIGWEDAENKIDAGEKAAFTCPECGGFYTEEHRTSMNHAAKLLHRGQEITPDGDIVGEVVKTDTLGFRWSAFNNLMVPMVQIGMEEWQASQREDNETAITTIKQQVWAIPAKVEKVDKTELTQGVIRGSDSSYRGRVTGQCRGELPANTQCLTVAIDIGLRFLPWSVCAHVANQSHRPDYGFHETPMPDVVGEETAIKSGLRELLKRLDNEYDVAIGLVDCGNWPDWVIETVLEFKGRGLWLPSRGVPQYRHPYSDDQKKTKIPPQHSQDQWYYDPVRGVVNFDADWWKHRVHGRWMVKPGNSQFCTLFGDDPREHNEFAKQLLAEEFRRELTRNGNVKESWFKVHRDNHQFDCEVLHLVGRSYVREQHHLASQPTAPLVIDSGDTHFDERW